MRTLIVTAGRVAMLASAALIVTACSGSESTSNTADNVADNMLLEEPANDASALESAANATEPLPFDNAANLVEAPATSGGDTGGNSVESNVTGM